MVLNFEAKTAALAVKTAVVVLGMHRSGTSSLGGALIQLGAQAPKTLMPGGIGNEVGYFESSAIVALNDRILASAGTSWDDWRAVSLDRGAAPTIDELEREAVDTLVQEYGAADLAMVKDPRMCRLFPFWHDVFERSGYAVRVIVPVRSPLEVAMSLQARDNFSLSKGLLMWLRHVLDAERDSRKLPRSILLWTDFLTDWRLSLARASEQTGLVWPKAPDQAQAEIDRFLTPSLRHNIAPAGALAVNPDVSDWIRETYGALEVLASDSASTDARRRLDEVRRDFETASVLFGPAFIDMEYQIEEGRRSTRECRAEMDERRAESDRLAEQYEAARSELDRTARRPWRRLKHLLYYLGLTALSTITRPAFPKASQRFKRSAEKRHPKRFGKPVRAANIAQKANALPTGSSPVAKTIARPLKGDKRQSLTYSPLAIRLAAAWRHPFNREKRRNYRSAFSLRVNEQLLQESRGLVDNPYLTRHPDLEGEDHPTIDGMVSIVIPTYNAGPEFALLLRKLRGQKGLKSVEIVTVDSESKDGTPRVAARHGCTVIPIKQSEFSHSRSRNLGAEAASGDYILFMVQDAFPIGDHWLYGLVRCLIDNRQSRGLAALSCAEYPRSDSELFYDALLKGHYDLIGCSDGDRLGEFVTEDHASLRKQGQLSDVACLIPKSLFDAYKYHGDYGEDLTLGVKLIRDGHRVGMLSSIRVIHSHNRAVDYYLRRAFVDVLFVTDTFADFTPPPDNDLEGTLAAAKALAQLEPDLTSDPTRSPVGVLDDLSKRARSAVVPAIADACDELGFAPLRPWLKSLYGRPGRASALVMSDGSVRSFKQTQAMYADRLDAMKSAASVYPVLDETVRGELINAIDKSLAMTIGAQLAFCCISPKRNQGIDGLEQRLDELQKILTAGV
jgi:GT2 family glycosyltransferase